MCVSYQRKKRAEKRRAAGKMFMVVGQAGAHGSHRGRSLVLWAMLSVQNKNKKSFKRLIITQKS